MVRPRAKQPARASQEESERASKRPRQGSEAGSEDPINALPGSSSSLSSESHDDGYEPSDGEHDQGFPAPWRTEQGQGSEADDDQHQHANAEANNENDNENDNNREEEPHSEQSASGREAQGQESDSIAAIHTSTPATSENIEGLMSGAIDHELRIERLEQQHARDQAEIQELKRHLAASQADRESMLASLHWLQDTVARLDPASSQTRPSLPPLAPTRRGGGGPKAGVKVTKPFLAQIWARMGRQDRQGIPDFEDPPPTLNGEPLLRFDWDWGFHAYRSLVEEVVDHIAKDNVIERAINDVGGLGEAVRLCEASLKNLFKRYRKQQRDASDPARKKREDSRRRMQSRVKDKTGSRQAVLGQDPTLRRRYQNSQFAIQETASVSVTEVKDNGSGDENGTGNETSQEHGDQEHGNNETRDARTGHVGHEQQSLGGGGTYLKPLRRLVPSWRSLELHNARAQTNLFFGADEEAQEVESEIEEGSEAVTVGQERVAEAGSSRQPSRCRRRS